MRKRLWFATGAALTLGFAWMQLHAGAQDADTAPAATNTLLPDAAPATTTPAALPATELTATPTLPLNTPPIATPPSGATPPLLPSPTASAPAAGLPTSDPMPPTGAPALPPPILTTPPTVVTSAGPSFGEFQTSSRDKRLQEAQLAREADLLSRDLSPTDEKQREQVRTTIKEKLNQVFDLQQARRAEEIAVIEARLTKLKETLDKRKQAKETIVERRVAQLLGDDELGWEESVPTVTTSPSGFQPSMGYGAGMLPQQMPSPYRGAAPAFRGPSTTIPAPQPQR